MIRSISCSLQLRLKSNESKKKKMVIKRCNGRSDIIIFFTQVSVIFKKMQLSFKFDLSGLAQLIPQNDEQITVIRLHSSGAFARTLSLRKPLPFIGRPLKKCVKNLRKYHTFMKTFFIQIKRLISNVCAFL